MRQLWLSSQTLGICIPNLVHSLASNNLVKIDNLGGIFLRAETSPPCTSTIQILVSEVQSQLRYYFLVCARFWPCYFI